MKRKNVKIELLRFIFAMSVVFFHCVCDYWPEGKQVIGPLHFFPHGRLGVEFFFLVSGYLMAATIKKRAADGEAQELGKETADFLKRKIKPILPYHLLFCAITIAITAIKSSSIVKLGAYVWNNLPSLFFLHCTGIMGNNRGFLSVEWYISAMLMVFLVLYPACRGGGRSSLIRLHPCLG